MLLEEYYNSGDLNEAAVSLQVGGTPPGGHLPRRRAAGTWPAALHSHAAMQQQQQRPSPVIRINGCHLLILPDPSPPPPPTPPTT